MININNILNEINNLPSRCKICGEIKEIDKFYKYEYKIENKIFYERIIDFACKDCLDLNSIEWNVPLKYQPKVNNELFRNLLFNKQIQKLEKNEIIFNNLVPRIEAIKMLNFVDKNQLKKITKIGLLNEIKIINKFNNENFLYNVFYKKEDIELVKWYRERGRFVKRGGGSILNGKIFEEKYPYLRLGKDNRQYLFINKIEKRKPCVLCLEVRSFDEFYYSESYNHRTANTCKNCSQKKSQKRYKNFTDIERKKHIQQVKDWTKQNKDKIRLYRKKLNKSINYRLKHIIRRRMQDVVFKLKNTYSNDEEKFKFMKNKLKECGCTYKELKGHIESKFQPGMTWENYGPGYLIDSNGKIVKDEKGDILKLKQWNIDHIKPISSFDLENPDELNKINHFSNLQPLWSEDNIKKGINIDWMLPQFETKIFEEEFINQYNKIDESL